jgi:serine/threonine protein phosphatase PrpC
VTAVDLSKDHKPELPEERKRISQAGGLVKKADEDVCGRVYAKDQEFPGLAMSRSMGDFCVKPYGVIATPEIATWKLEPKQDLFILVCSDGVWEFLTSQQAVNFVYKFPREQAQKAADALAVEARKLWMVSGAGVVDDITVVLNWL